MASKISKIEYTLAKFHSYKNIASPDPKGHAALGPGEYSFVRTRRMESNVIVTLSEEN